MDLSPLDLEYCKNSSSERIKKSPRWDDDEGVAATVGTIMTLLVFLTFMGMFTNQFVPVWMSDNESAHMTTAIAQMTDLKSKIDGLIADNANSQLAPTPVFVPLTLSAPGIPVFAGPTAGILTFAPESTYGRPSFNVTYLTSGGFQLDSSNDGHTGGYIDLYCPNRYYVEQHLVYENGAVIINQTEGEVIIAGIQFSVSTYVSGSTTSRVVKLTQVSMVGLNKTIGGTGSRGINADLLYADTRAYSNSAGSDLTIVIASPHAKAWYDFFSAELNASTTGLTYGTDFTVTLSDRYDIEGQLNDYYILTVTIHEVNVLDHTKATVQISIGELGV